MTESICWACVCPRHCANYLHIFYSQLLLGESTIIFIFIKEDTEASRSWVNTQVTQLIR